MKDTKFYNINAIKIAYLIFGIIGILTLYGCGLKGAFSPDTTLNFNTQDLIGQNYNDITPYFKNLGFTDIEYEVIEDLTSESELTDGTVESISINNKDDCKQGESYPKKSKILIKYHALISYDTKLIIDFPGNLIFNKYDVVISLDGQKIDTLGHGQDLEKTYSIKDGTHTLTFSEDGSSSVKGEVELSVKGPTEASYKISCYDKYVNVSEIYSFSEIPLKDGQIQMLTNGGEYKYKDYKDVQEMLSSIGFNNIILVPKYDIYWGITPTGEVQSVLITGTDTFKKGDVFNNDDEVKIVYHMPYDQDPDYVSSHSKPENSSDDDSSEASKDSDDSEDNLNHDSEEELTYEDEAAFYEEIDKINADCKDKPFKEYRDSLLEKGYNLEYIHENTKLDFTGELNSMSDADLAANHWIFRGVYDFDFYKNSITLMVNTTENIERLESQKSKEEKLAEKLDPAAALAALEIYGNEQFEYGFRIHMLLGKHAETAYDENTWFMKYDAKYRDWSGSWVECTVEGKIKGTTDNPEVFDFYVY